ncbi:MAG: hypothetical protein AB1489_15615 [Acidobacteriota bacterium]
MKKCLLLLCLALAVLILPCQLIAAINPTTQGYNRTLAITGTTFDNKRYSGTLEVRSRKISSPSSQIEGVTLKWNVGGTIYQGIGISTGNILTATWGGNSCSLVVYAVEGKKLNGIWTVAGANALGTEVALINTGKGIAGSYSVTGTNGNGSAYKGALDIIERGPVYQFSWKVGANYEGIGIKTADLISVAWSANPKDTCGVVQYEIVNSGLKNGKWGIYGQNALGTEEGVLK